jgi:hypothetical protein
VKVGVFFVCMRKFLYLCIANKVKKAFFMVLYYFWFNKFVFSGALGCEIGRIFCFFW